MTLKPTRIYELTIASLEELDEVRTLVDRAAKEFHLGEELAYWMELTVTESMINAIRHGNHQDPSKNASLRISCNGSSIEVIVEDQGEGFNLESLADPREAQNLFKPSGRGILIIRSFMDEVAMSAREGGGSRLRMVKKIEEIR